MLSSRRPDRFLRPPSDDNKPDDPRQDEDIAGQDCERVGCREALGTSLAVKATALPSRIKVRPKRTRSPAMITAMPTNWPRCTAVQLALLAYSANTTLWLFAGPSVWRRPTIASQPRECAAVTTEMQVIGSVGRLGTSEPAHTGASAALIDVDDGIKDEGVRAAGGWPSR